MNKFIKKVLIVISFIVFSYTNVVYCNEINNLTQIYNKFTAEDKILLAECINKFDAAWEVYLDKAVNKYDIYNNFKNSYFDENDKYITNNRVRIKDKTYYKKPSHASILLNIILSMMKLQYYANSNTGDPSEYEYGMPVFERALESINSEYIKEYLQGTSKALDKVNEEKPNYEASVYAYADIIKKYMQDYLRFLKFSSVDLDDKTYCVKADYNLDTNIYKNLFGDNAESIDKYIDENNQNANMDFALAVYLRDKMYLDIADNDICDYDDIYEFLNNVKNEEYLKG